LARQLSPQALRLLSAHTWPGNVRELGNVIHRAVILSSSETVTVEDLAACRFPPVRTAARSAVELESVSDWAPSAEHVPRVDYDHEHGNGDGNRYESEPLELDADRVLGIVLGDVLEQPGSRIPSLKDVEDAYITAVLDRCEGNKTRAARLLGIDVSTLHRRERRKS
jgi:DNA-binding NtrC family response regulator